MPAKRKRHLRYQAKKSHANEQEAVLSSTNSAADGKKSHQKLPFQAGETARNKSVERPTKRELESYTKLPAEETKFIRRELIYIAIIAVVIIVLYIGILLLFRITQIDEWLNSLIKLNSRS